MTNSKTKASTQFSYVLVSIYINIYIYMYVYQSLYHIYNICAYTSTVSFISRYFPLCLCRLCLPRASFFDNSEVGVGSWADDYWYIYNKYIHIYIIIYTILCIYIYINGIHIFIAKPFLDTPLSDTSRYQMVDCISIYIYSHWGVRDPVIQIYIYIHKYIYTYTHIYIHIFLLMIFIINTFWQPYESITNFTNNHVDR